MATKTIYGVFGDRGGLNAALPVLAHALEEGCSVNLFLVATCAKQCQEGSLTFDRRINSVTGTDKSALARRITQFAEEPHDLFIVGASTSSDGADAAANAMIASQARWFMVIQDMYGSAVPALRRVISHEHGHKMNITVVCVTDEISRDNLSQALTFRPQIVVTGGPHFDQVVELRRTWADRRRKLRDAMQVADTDIVLLVPGQLNGMAEAMVLIEEGAKLAGVDDRTYMVCRPHPRGTALDKKLYQYCRQAMPSRLFKELGPDLVANSEEALPGMDGVVSGYSTTNRVGILCEMPGVVYLGTPSFRADLLRQEGLQRPTEVEMGAGWYVETPEEMRFVLDEFNRDVPSPNMQGIRAAQKKMAAKVDGHATERVWKEMKNLLDAH